MCEVPDFLPRLLSPTPNNHFLNPHSSIVIEMLDFNMTLFSLTAVLTKLMNENIFLSYFYSSSGVDVCFPV